MLISSDMKMADLIHLNYYLLNIIKRFEIKLGFAEKTVNQVCDANKVNVDFFLEIVNAFNDKDYFPKKNLQNFSVLLIIDYLKKTHKYYLNELVPNIESMIDSVENKNNLNLIKNFFAEYKKELKQHIEREELVVYPYVLSLYEIINGEQKDLNTEYSIEIFANEHDNIEEKLFDLKNIIIKYLPDNINSNTFNKILYSLFTLEKDLNDHSRIEEKVMIPKVLMMEKELKKR